MASSLQDLIDLAGGPLRLLSNTGAGGYLFPVVPGEQTSWQNEQRAWMEDCVLMDQTHHMDDLYLEGPDIVRLLSDTGINNFANFKPGMAKQHIMCGPEGYLIADNIVAWLQDGRGCPPGSDPATTGWNTRSRPAATTFS